MAIKQGTGLAGPTILYSDGSIYVGEAKHGLLNGQGTLAFADGDVMDGK